MAHIASPFKSKSIANRSNRSDLRWVFNFPVFITGAFTFFGGSA